MMRFVIKSLFQGAFALSVFFIAGTSVSPTLAATDADLIWTKHLYFPDNIPLSYDRGLRNYPISADGGGVYHTWESAGNFNTDIFFGRLSVTDGAETNNVLLGNSFEHPYGVTHSFAVADVLTDANSIFVIEGHYEANWPGGSLKMYARIKRFSPVDGSLLSNKRIDGVDLLGSYDMFNLRFLPGGAALDRTGMYLDVRDDDYHEDFSCEDCVNPTPTVVEYGHKVVKVNPYTGSILWSSPGLGLPDYSSMAPSLHMETDSTSLYVANGAPHHRKAACGVYDFPGVGVGGGWWNLPTSWTITRLDARTGAVRWKKSDLYRSDAVDDQYSSGGSEPCPSQELFALSVPTTLAVDDSGVYIGGAIRCHFYSVNTGWGNCIDNPWNGGFRKAVGVAHDVGGEIRVEKRSKETGDIIWADPLREYGGVALHSDGAKLFRALSRTKIPEGDFFQGTFGGHPDPDHPSVLQEIDPRSGSVAWERPFGIYKSGGLVDTVYTRLTFARGNTSGSLYLGGWAGGWLQSDTFYGLFSQRFGLATVDLKINASDGPMTVQAGAAMDLTWTSSGMTSCLVTSGVGWRTPGAVIPTASTIPDRVIATADSQYVISCLDSVGVTHTDTVAVTLVPSLKVCEVTPQGLVLRGTSALATPMSFSMMFGETRSLVAHSDTSVDCSSTTNDVTSSTGWSGSDNPQNVVSFGTLVSNRKPITAGSVVGSEGISASYSGLSANMVVSTSCQPTSDCSTDPRTQTVCIGKQFQIENGCGGQAPCDGKRNCDFNYKEVAP